MKKLLSLALVAAMAISSVATTAFAAVGNVSFSSDVSEVAPGENIVVTINSLAKTISTDGFYLLFDDSKLDFVSLADDYGDTTDTQLFTITYLNSRGKETDREFSVAGVSGNSVSFGFANTDDVEYFEKEGFATVTFKAKDDASGAAEFVLMENSAGASGYVGEVDRKSVEIKKSGVDPVDPAITGITIDPTEATVNGGETVTFTATVTGTDGNDAEGAVIPYDKTVTWSDNAPEGVFTAPEATDEVQTFEVTATAADGKVATATVKVPAKTYEVVAPVITGITIDPETVTVKGGEKVTFTATVEGTDGQDETGAVVPYDKTVTWSANALEGVFTAPEAKEEAQTIEVTATAADGKVATATVTVEAKEAPATVVTVTDATATTNETYKAQNTMYWGVKIVNGLKGAVQAWMTADEETSKTTTLDFSNVTINGDAEFGVFTKVAVERLDKAISLNVKDVASGTVGMSTAASYNSLAK